MDILAFQKTVKLFIQSQKTHDEAPWLRQKAFFLEFLGFVTSKVSTMYQVWDCYGDVCYQCAGNNSDKEKGIRMYVKALRQLLNTPKVDSDFQVFMTCAKKSEKYLKCFDEFVTSDGERCCPEDLRNELVGSIRNLKNFYNLEGSHFESVTPETEKYIDDMKKVADEFESKLKN